MSRDSGGVAAKYTAANFTPGGMLGSNGLDGSRITPLNNSAIWLHCADIWNKDHLTLDEICADPIILKTLMGNANALRYVIRSKGAIMANIMSSSIALTACDASRPCITLIFGDADWYSAVIKSSVALSVILSSAVKIPTLIENSSSIGAAYILPGYAASMLPFYAYDSVLTNWAGVSNAQNGPDNMSVPYPHSFGFRFFVQGAVYFSLFKFAYYVPSVNHPYLPKDCILQSSVDGITFTDIYPFTIDRSKAGWVEITLPQPSPPGYDFRLQAMNGYYGSYNWSGMAGMQFYTKEVLVIDE